MHSIIIYRTIQALEDFWNLQLANRMVHFAVWGFRFQNYIEFIIPTRFFGIKFVGQIQNSIEKIERSKEIIKSRLMDCQVQVKVRSSSLPLNSRPLPSQAFSRSTFVDVCKRLSHKSITNNSAYKQIDHRQNEQFKIILRRKNRNLIIYISCTGIAILRRKLE